MAGFVSSRYSIWFCSATLTIGKQAIGPLLTSRQQPHTNVRSRKRVRWPLSIRAQIHQIFRYLQYGRAMTAVGGGPAVSWCRVCQNRARPRAVPIGAATAPFCLLPISSSNCPNGSVWDLCSWVVIHIVTLPLCCTFLSRCF